MDIYKKWKRKNRPSEDVQTLLWAGELVYRDKSPSFFRRQYIWTYTFWSLMMKTNNNLLFDDGQSLDFNEWKELEKYDKMLIEKEKENRRDIEDSSLVSKNHLLPPKEIFEDKEGWDPDHPCGFSSAISRDLPYPWNQSTTPFTWSQFTLHTVGVGFSVGVAMTVIGSLRIIWDLRKVNRHEWKRFFVVRVLKAGSFVPGFAFSGLVFALSIKFIETYIHYQNPYVLSLSCIPVTAIAYHQLQIQYGRNILTKLATIIPVTLFFWGSTIKRPEFDFINRKFRLESKADTKYYVRLANEADVILKVDPYPETEQQLKYHLSEFQDTFLSARTEKRSSNFYDKYS